MIAFKPIAKVIVTTAVLLSASVTIAQEEAPKTVTVRVTTANGDVTDIEVHTEKTAQGNTLKTDKITHVSNGDGNGGSTNQESNQKKLEQAIITTFDLSNKSDLRALISLDYD